MVEYKLTYFNGKGRAEVTRMMLSYAGMPFTDNRITENWQEIKLTTPLGQVPVLEIDGGKITIVQSLAIARYIARETGVAGDDSLQQAQVDMIAETANELMTKKEPIIFEKDPEKKAELDKAFQEVLVPRILTFLEKAIANNSCHSGYFVGESVTLADFIVWHLIEYQSNTDAKCLDTYPNVKANREKVSSLSKFAEYLKNRPKTAF